MPEIEFTVEYITSKDYRSAIDRAFSTSAKDSTNAMYFIQTKLLFGELLTNFSNSSSSLGISFSSNLSSAALISCSLLKKIASHEHSYDMDNIALCELVNRKNR